MRASGTEAACTSSLSGSVDQMFAVVRVGVADHRVAPLDQLAGVAPRHVEQPGQHLDREVGADLLDEVEFGPVPARRPPSPWSGRAGTPRSCAAGCPRGTPAGSACAAPGGAAPSVSRIDRRMSIRSSSTSSRLTNLVEVKVSGSLSTAQMSSCRVTAQNPVPWAQAPGCSTPGPRGAACRTSPRPRCGRRVEVGRGRRRQGQRMGALPRHLSYRQIWSYPNDIRQMRSPQGLAIRSRTSYRTDTNDLSNPERDA